MSSISDSQYTESFKRTTGKESPYPYQIEVARLLFAGRNVLLRAPTGAGKTWAVIAPFLSEGWSARPNRLIYALPLRTLANGIYREACEAAARLGKPLEAVPDKRGRQKVHPFVTLQTGEQPDDQFFDRGTIIVTTYDQVLSGLLCGPYGLSERLHNVNAAAIAGALVVFDEFHLMPAAKAFLTAVAGLHLFRELCQSVWMTATATEPLEQLLRSVLKTAVVPDGDAAMDSMQSLPSVASVNRSLVTEAAHLTADAILKHHRRRSIAIVNTVGRAQQLFGELLARRNEHPGVEFIMLHSRFFKSDRQRLEERLQKLFGKDAAGSAILVATQVIEAGIDISCEHLHTELCPMNSLAQRAGRCARFPNETGVVHVYALPDEPRSWLPYGDPRSASRALTETAILLAEVPSSPLNPEKIAKCVNSVHSTDDDQALRGWLNRKTEVVKRITLRAIQRNKHIGVADLIRGDSSENIKVIVADKPPDTPGKREGISLTRWSLARLLDGARDIGWFWDGTAEEPAWRPLQEREELGKTYAVCIRLEFARYTNCTGLTIDASGTVQSPDAEPPLRPGHAPIHAEPWVRHAQCVAAEIKRRLVRDCPSDGMLIAGFARRYELNSPAIHEAAIACGLLHDLGKLQTAWQRWAEAAMRARDGLYNHSTALAHTDFNSDDPDDRQREREVSKIRRRPSHAPASAFFALKLIPVLTLQSPSESGRQIASSCLAAILAHHGGWIPPRRDFQRAIDDLVPEWTTLLPQALDKTFDPARVLWLKTQPDRYGQLSNFLRHATGPEGNELTMWWPIVAFLTRTLRLSDQRATAETHNS